VLFSRDESAPAPDEDALAEIVRLPQPEGHRLATLDIDLRAVGLRRATMPVMKQPPVARMS
jgi:hypothetical protein